jgi:hypothetical protein
MTSNGKKTNIPKWTKFKCKICGREFYRKVYKNDIVDCCSQGCFAEMRARKGEGEYMGVKKYTLNKVVQEILVFGEKEFLEIIELGKRVKLGERQRNNGSKEYCFENWTY